MFGGYGLTAGNPVVVPGRGCQSSPEHVKVRVRANCERPSEKNLSSLLNRNARSLTVWIAGEQVNGRVLCDVLVHTKRHGQCPNLTRLVVERRDNDWDNPQTLISWNRVADEQLAYGLRDHPTLRDVSIEGFSRLSPIQNLCSALITVPHLTSLSLKAVRVESSSSSSSQQAEQRRRIESENRFPPDVLRQLLMPTSAAGGGKQTHIIRLRSLCLVGLMPQSNVYTSILEEAYLLRGCRAHLTVYFCSGGGGSYCGGGHQQQQRDYAHFIREVRELNVKEQEKKQTKRRGGRGWRGRRRIKGLDDDAGGGDGDDGANSTATVAVAAGQFEMERLFELASLQDWHVVSVDGIYSVIRHNPWLCDRNNGATRGDRKKKGSWKKGMKTLFRRQRR